MNVSVIYLAIAPVMLSLRNQIQEKEFLFNDSKARFSMVSACLISVICCGTWNSFVFFLPPTVGLGVLDLLIA